LNFDTRNVRDVIPIEPHRHAWREHWEHVNERTPIPQDDAFLNEWFPAGFPGECTVCFDRPRTVVFTGCHHLAICEDCYVKTLDRRCPICRKISDGMHVMEYREWMVDYPFRPHMPGGCHADAVSYRPVRT